MHKKNDWDVGYTQILFLSKVLKGHSKVSEFSRTRDIFFEIKRCPPLNTVKALLVNVYTFGLAAYYKAKSEFPDINCVIVGGDWNGYTKEAKDLAMSEEIGLFAMSEFLGALNLAKVYSYVKLDEEKRPIYNYHSPDRK